MKAAMEKLLAGRLQAEDVAGTTRSLLRNEYPVEAMERPDAGDQDSGGPYETRREPKR